MAAHKRYDFGQNVSVTTNNRGNWIVGINLCEGNPYDGHTLAKAIATTERVTSVPVTNAFVDKGYRGHDYQGEATIHLAGSSTRRLRRTQKQRRKRRSAVEPKIGHLKTDSRMSRCFLKRLAGDSIIAVLAAAGSNLMKLLREISHALEFWLWSRLVDRLTPLINLCCTQWPPSDNRETITARHHETHANNKQAFSGTTS